MKNFLINITAIWATTLSTWQDGDIFRETQTDLVISDIGDRLGYLKTALDLKPDLSDTQTWTGLNTFHPSTGLPGIKVYKELTFPDPATELAAALTAGIIHRERAMANADGIEAPNAEVLVVPAINANRLYTIGSYGGNDGKRVRVRRPRTGDAFTVTLQDAGSNAICVIPASQHAWVDIEYRAAKTPVWGIVGYGGTFTSMAGLVV